MKRLIITLAAAATAAGASAQQWGGLLMDKDLLMPTDMIELSQTQFNFGTARAMAMAGAFTSLGADLSSMSINPAGLGMYRHGDISITPMMSFARSKGNAPEYGRNSRDRFSMANIGVVINAYEGSRSLISLNVGFGYNRIADFNYDYGFVRQNQGGTIGDAYARQLNWDGVSKNDFYTNGGSGDWVWPNDPQYWNAMLAYRGFLIDQTDPDDPGTWKPTWVGNNAGVDHYTMLRSKGSIGEYVLSVGANINNKIYIGASLGIQSVYQRKYIDYVEEYFYDAPSQNTPDFGNSGLDYQLLRWKLNQSVIVDGTGVNFKAGIVYRPTANLRLGAAIHTPTYYSLDYSYRADIFSDIRNNADNKVATVGNATPRANNSGGNSWDFTSPARLMFGASYTFGTFAIVSIDYERDWYNGIRVKNVPQYNYFSEEDYKAEFKHNFQGTNSIRAGVEVKPLPILALRVGGGYTDSMLKERDFYVNDAYTSMPTTYESYYFSAGAGVNLGRNTTLDLAYQYVTNKQTQYQLFFSRPENGGDMETWSGLYDTSLKRHYLAATLSFRF